MGFLTTPKGWWGMTGKDDDPFTSLETMMDRYFQNAFDRPTSLLKTSKDWEKEFGHFTPQVDIRDTGDSIFVKAELPGMNQKDVDVTLDKDRITLKGEKKFEKEGDENDRHYVERRYGSFYRTIPLPYEVDREKAAATFKDGVLNIELHKCQEAKTETRKIAIKS